MAEDNEVFIEDDAVVLEDTEILQSRMLKHQRLFRLLWRSTIVQKTTVTR